MFTAFQIFSPPVKYISVSARGRVTKQEIFFSVKHMQKHPHKHTHKAATDVPNWQKHDITKIDCPILFMISASGQCQYIEAMNCFCCTPPTLEDYIKRIALKMFLFNKNQTSTE